MKVLIIGAGFAGAAAAFELRKRFAADITLLESAPHSGGMLRTYTAPSGAQYEYGPRIVSVFRGTQDFMPWIEKLLTLQPRDVYQGTRLRPEYDPVPFPVDRQSLLKLPCGEKIGREWAALAANGRGPDETNLKTYLESTVGPTLTGLAFAPFNLKFWERRLEDIPAEWGKLRRLERIAETGAYRLPSVAPHYYPVGGFNGMFVDLLRYADVRYGVKVGNISQSTAGGRGVTVETNVGKFEAEVVVSTAPIDLSMGNRFGELEWKGYRIETETINKPALGHAPDGVPFSWLYTPYSETSVCRTTDFGVIHNGNTSDKPGVLLREIPDNSVKMYPVWWEDEKFSKYLTAASQVRGLIPLGRLGMYKYVTMDSTYGMVQRLCETLGQYSESNDTQRFDILRNIRGDWLN